MNRDGLHGRSDPVLATPTKAGLRHPEALKFLASFKLVEAK